MEGRLYLRLVRRNAWLAVVLVALCVAVGAAFFVLSPPRYESTLSFAVRPSSDSGSSAEIYQGELLAQSRAKLYGGLVTGPAFAALVSARLGGEPTAARVQRDVQASVQDGSVVVGVSVTDRSAAGADSVAHTVADAFPEYVMRLEGFPAAPSTALRLIDDPSGAKQVAPTLTRSLGLGLLGGLVLAFLAAAVRELANRRVRDLDDVRGVVGPGVAGADLSRRGPPGRRTSAVALLPLSVLFASAAGQGRPVAVVPLSPGPRAARGTIRLATRLAMAGQRVALVDADLEGRHLALTAPARGWWRRARATPDRGVLDGSGHDGVELLGAEVVAAVAAGGTAADSAGPPAPEVVGAAAMKVASEAGEHADVVLVLTDGVLLRSRPAFVGREESEVIALVERARTRKEELRSAVEVVRELGSEVRAVVLVPRRGRRR